MKFPLEDNVKRVIARPFSGSHEKMVDYLGTGFTVQIKEVLKWIETEPQSMEKKVLKYQIEKYRDKIEK